MGRYNKERGKVFSHDHFNVEKSIGIHLEKQLTTFSSSALWRMQYWNIPERETAYTRLSPISSGLNSIHAIQRCCKFIMPIKLHALCLTYTYRYIAIVVLCKDVCRMFTRVELTYVSQGESKQRQQLTRKQH